MHVIVVSQDPEITDYFSYVLQRAGLQVSLRHSIDAVVANWSDSPAHLIILHNRNDPDTKTALGNLRSVSTAHVLVLLDQPNTDVEAEYLLQGADLVLHLPIGPKLLSAYVQASLRRAQAMTLNLLPSIDLAKISLYPASRTVRVLDKPPEKLTQLEFKLLYLLMTHPGHVISADVIVDRVWGYSEGGSKELVRGLVSRLRSKVEPNPREPIFIHTLAGVGYLFEPEQ